mgnify:CR=1 FL=1
MKFNAYIILFLARIDDIEDSSTLRRGIPGVEILEKPSNMSLE